MLAHTQGGVLNAAALARGLGVDGRTVSRYLDLMVDLLLVRRLTPWRGNVGKRLIKSPKVYVRDSGIVYALLGLGSKEEILGHPIAGLSWEGSVIESLLSVAPDRTEASFYRASGGAGIDLVLTLPGRQPWAVEIRRSLNPRPSRGFHSACKDVEPEASFVVYPGGERYRVAQDVEALRVVDLASEIAAKDLGSGLVLVTANDSSPAARGSPSLSLRRWVPSPVRRGGRPGPARGRGAGTGAPWP